MLFQNYDFLCSLEDKSTKKVVHTTYVPLYKISQRKKIITVIRHIITFSLLYLTNLPDLPEKLSTI